MKHCLITAIVCASLFGCAEIQLDSEGSVSSKKTGNSNAELGAPTVGVLLTSHGDINDYDEIEGYLRSAFLKNVGVPLPRWVREWVENPAYGIARGGIEEQYDIIGPTRYRENANLQAERIRQALERKGVNATVYVGYNFMPPFVEDAVAEAHADGIEELVVFNKGAQFSLATLGESIEEIDLYMATEEAADWHVDMVAVRQFSDDERFRELFARVLDRDAKHFFPEVPAADVCLFVASHGLPLRLIRMGDPATEQMLEVVEDLKARLPQYPIYHGFLNDDFFPGAAWVDPPSDDTAWDIRNDSCPATLMDGRLSFTTHHRATLFDLDVAAREIIEETPDLQANGEPHPLFKPLKAVLAPQWDDEPDFAALMADLTIEALQGEGDLIELY